jgi:predicted AlkP superfamily pyrophosphatase or phosphodiesterase
MLDEFISWMTDRYGYGYVKHIHELASSVVVDFENDNIIGRFTVWNDFSLMSEVIEVKTGEFRINERHEFSNLSELEKFFVTFTSFLS